MGKEKIRISTENLYVGLVVPNKKALSRLIGDPYKGGKMLKGREKRIWPCYLTYRKLEGNAIEITEIFNPPKPMPAKENAIYTKDIELIITNALSNMKSKTLSLSKTNWYILLGLANESYRKPKDAYESNGLIYPQDWLTDDFYSNCNNKLGSIFTPAIKSMANRGIITHSSPWYIVEVDVLVAEDKWADVLEKSRIATEDEARKIAEVREQVRHDLGYADIPFSKKLKYQNEVDKRIRAMYNWYTIFQRVEIKHTGEYAIDIVSQMVLEERKAKLNELAISEVKKIFSDYCAKNKSINGKVRVNGKELLPKVYTEKQHEFTEVVLAIE